MLNLGPTQYSPPTWDDLPIQPETNPAGLEREALRESVYSFLTKVIPVAIRRMGEGDYPPALCRELLNRLNNHIQIAGELGCIKEETRLIQTLRNVAARMDALVYS
ncbi:MULTISPECIES: hypothetical protein [Burkholderia]|uniref:hypothetical protein n=1 Tax=Burkholderia TaxID=32008 RepID=UPI0011B22F1B|nr:MULTISPECIES: hypothetical protein [Burkholderia]MBG0863125.1 hypothetical protein [Burkholderia sp. 9779_493]MBU9297522.1 hypothetical protein [Burkholderia multivorans]MBU9308876.1 hypothetical protein [Burkholderia multivorans]MBU9403518.1 hypothetical protein [Burkholderia multivorans]MCO1460595.1 hypothetical protein [Burkholderia multivorans]